jgi:hypothetical protein
VAGAVVTGVSRTWVSWQNLPNSILRHRGTPPSASAELVPRVNSSRAL